MIVVIGGLGSLGGAFVASLMIGLLQSYAIASNLGMPDLLNLLGLEFSRDHPLNDLWTLTLPQIAPVPAFSAAGASADLPANGPCRKARGVMC